MYENHIKVGEGSRVRSNEFNSTNVNFSSTIFMRNKRDLNTSLDEIMLGLNLLSHTFDDYTMNIVEPSNSLALCHPKMIDYYSSS